VESLLVLACALSLTLSLAAVCWCALLSTPAELRKIVSRALDSSLTAEAKADATQALFVAHKADTAAIHEAVEGVLDSVERKRKQISGAKSRLAAVQEEDVPKTRDDIVSHYRAKVYGLPGS